MRRHQNGGRSTCDTLVEAPQEGKAKTFGDIMGNVRTKPSDRAGKAEARKLQHTLADTLAEAKT